MTLGSGSGSGSSGNKVIIIHNAGGCAKCKKNVRIEGIELLQLGYILVKWHLICSL